MYDNRKETFIWAVSLGYVRLATAGFNSSSFQQRNYNLQNSVTSSYTRQTSAGELICIFYMTPTLTHLATIAHLQGLLFPFADRGGELVD